MTTKATSLPRYWKVKIAALTGLQFCDRNCGCGENSKLWFFPTPSSDNVPEWVPDWMNGVDTDEVWQWLVENGRAT